ncbi:MAG: tetratricopeptide repeat protein, partial [Bryobacteraceae bacterium]
AADRTLGTAAYMSPEQAHGIDVDARGDVFSFGSLLYELATGQPPFQGDSDLTTLYKVVNTSPLPVQHRRAEIPDGLARVIEKALEKLPENRYQRMEALLEDLKVLQVEYHGVDPTTARTAVVMQPVASTRRRALKWAGAGAGALGMVYLGSRIGWRPKPAETHLAVLPFRNIGSDPAGQAFCDGVVETLTSMLTQLERFHGSLVVVPSSEVRNQQVSSPSEALKAFGASLVISGSVQRSASDVRLNINLVDARSLRQVAARTVEAKIEDISALQDSVVAQTGDLLDLQLEPRIRSELAAGGTRVAAAYDAYIQARGQIYRTDRRGNLDVALDLLRLAVERDRNYALGHSELAYANTMMFRQTKEVRWLATAQSAAERAIALNERIASAHVNLGVVYSLAQRHEEAIGTFRRALERDPVNAAAYRELASAYEALSQSKEAESTYQKAIQMRPADWLSHQSLGVFYYAKQRYANAEPLFQKVIELTPDNYLGYRNLGGVQLSRGRLEDAARNLRRSIEIKPSAAAYSNLGTLYMYEGRYREAVTEMEQAMALGGSNYANDYRIWLNLGDAYRGSEAHAIKAPGAYRQAIQLAQRLLALNPRDAAVLSSVAVGWAKLGEREKAAAQIAEAITAAPGDASVRFKSALVHELGGRRTDALAALDTALRAGYSSTEIRHDPALAALRKDPRYAILAQNLKQKE